MRVEAELEETEGVFELVSEEEYARLVQDRQRDAWICDDGAWVNWAVAGQSGGN